MTAAVVLERATKVYSGTEPALAGVSIQVEKGELLVLLGPSGSGKTTILRIIAGLEELSSGDLWLDGEDAVNQPPQDRNIAMVFQDCALYPHLTVRGNLAFPLEVAGQDDKQTIEVRVRQVARGLGIEDLLDRRPHMLSGGERQRAAMGRALVRGEPTVLLMDEPLAALDTALRTELRAELGSLIRSLNLTTVYVTHDQAEALSIADRVAVLRDGALEDIGPPGRVYSDPATAFAAAFLGSPPITLAMATIWVINGEKVVIDFGTQQLTLPWDDPFSEALTLYHTQPVIIGIRPEALMPALTSPGAVTLHGKISSLEYQGHEWLARLEAGLRPADLDQVGTRLRRRPPATSGRGSLAGGRGRVRPALKPPLPKVPFLNAPPAAALPRTAAPLPVSLPATESPGMPARHSPAATTAATQHGAHRGASLLIRLGSAGEWVAGQAVRVAVDTTRIFAFDTDGRRIRPFDSSGIPPAGPR